MAPDGPDLDLILKTRLDLLEQAVREVEEVIKEVTVQKGRISEVEEFLAPAGTLASTGDNVEEHLTGAIGRLQILKKRDARISGPTPVEPDNRTNRLDATLAAVQEATREMTAMADAREAAYQAFQDLKRWSVAELIAKPPTAAVNDYKNLIREIRAARKPWLRYENEIPRVDHELFAGYLERVAGMAVRRIELDTDVTDHVDSLNTDLGKPIEGAKRPQSMSESPLALIGAIGRRHLPLGYPEWSLWALPLVGRTDIELVTASIMPRESERWSHVDNRTRILCGDLYAQYVLGPSHVLAAVFLYFDPKSEPSAEIPSDALRAKVLIDHLPELGDGVKRDILQPTADKIRKEWAKARQVFDGAEPDLDDSTSAMLSDFLAQVRKEYPDLAYDVQRVEEIAEAGSRLADEATPDDKLTAMRIRDLICAMWLARIEQPDRAELINRRAKVVAQRERLLRANPPKSKPLKDKSWGP
jgi:hypothetical protein